MIPLRSKLAEVGTASSGFHGHVGVAGHRGGSAPSNGPTIANGTTKDEVLANMGLQVGGYDPRKGATGTYGTREYRKAPETRLVKGPNGEPLLVDYVDTGKMVPQRMNERPLPHVYRAISEEDYQRMKRDDVVNTDARMNLVNSEGLVTSHEDPTWYLPGKLASNSDGEYPGRVIRIKVEPLDGWKVDTDGYVKTNVHIPFSRIDMVSPKIVTVKKSSGISDTRIVRESLIPIRKKTKQIRVREAIAQIDKHVADLLYRARRSHVVSLEALIAQYQHDLWHVAETYTSKLEGAIDNEKLMHTQLVQMVSHLERIGESYAENAANLGFERCLKDLVLYGYLKAYQTPVIAPGEYSRPAVLANHDYLHHSLLPDLHAVLSTTADIAKVYGTFANRIKMYGHYLWRVAEAVYRNGVLDFDAKLKTNLKEVGTAASGNWGHLSVKGHQGGSAPSSHSYSDAPFLNFPEAVKQSSLYKRNSEFKAAYDSGNLDLAYQIHNADFTARMDQTFGSTETPTVSADQVSSGAGIAAAQYIRDNYAGVETLDRYHSALATLNDAVTNTNLPLSAGLAELHNAAAAHWDKQYPNGGELYRGLSPNGGQKFTSTYNEGDVIKLTPLFSTTDNAGFARQFLADFHDRGDEAMTPGGVALTFKGVTGADLAVSYHTSDAFKQPGGVGDKEILMLGKRSWRITSMKKDPSGYGQSAVLEPTNVASKEAAFDSDDIAWRNCLREIGTASSGFHGHVGVYGHQGGSAPAGTGWKKISGPMGSNPGGVYASPDGTKHYVKLYANKEQGQSEILANKIYNHLGILAPDSTHVIVDGKDGVASPMLDGAKSMNASEIRSHSGYAKGVVADAYLANHDVIGLVNDNILRVGDNAVRIDNGGAMFFRAQGEPKEFGAKVDQLHSMFDPSRRIGTFTSGVPESERATQARHIVNSLSNSTIDRLTAESGLGQKYSSALKARRDDLAKHFGLLEIGTETSGNLGHKGIPGHKGGSLPNPNSAAQKQKSAFLATGENLHHYENNPKVKELVDKKLYGAAKKEIKAFPGGPVNTKPNSEMDSLDKFVKSGGFGTASKPETTSAEFVATHKADLQAKIDQVDLSSMNLPAGMNEANKVQLQARIANLKGISINDTLNMKPPVAGNNRGIKTALNNWSGTTDSPGALGLRAAINEMQDKEATHSFSKATLGKYNQILDAPNSGSANDMIAYRESIKANFKEFQTEQGRYFDKKYGPGTEQNATLYRGLRSREAEEVAKLNIGDSVVLPTARSYTLDRAKTTNFTNAFEGTKYIIRLQNVSGKDHVFASQAHTNGGLHIASEREVIVMGNHNEWEVSDIHKSDAYKTYVTLKPKIIKEAEVAKPKTLVLYATALDDDEAPVWRE